MSIYQKNLMTDKKIFLIKNNESIKSIEKSILDAPYISLSETFSSIRYRGTKIVKKDNNYHIITWQRNIARLQKMDVSLPTIISITLNDQLIIQSIMLNKSFAGSQGISCCYQYLLRILQQRLTGQKFTIDNKHLFMIDNLHCIHLHEILVAALSSMEELIINNLNEFEEVETGQSFEDGEDIKFLNYQQSSHGFFLNWEIMFHNYKKKLKFNRNGEIEKIHNINVSFRLIKNNKEDIYINQLINGDTNKNVISQLLKFTIKCKKIIIKELEIKTDFFHSNLLPVSLVGLIIQSLGIIIFSNNYNYFQYILAALQRKNDKPFCIGIVKNIEEAQKYFPQFRIEDLY